MRDSRKILSLCIPATVVAGLALMAFILPAEGQTRLPRVLAWESTVKGDENISLRWPVALAHGSAREIVVADSRAPQLLFFSDSGVTWTPRGSVPLDSAPVDIAADDDRYVVSLRGEPRLIAVEGEQHQIRRLAVPDGLIPGSLCSMPGGGVLVHDLNSGSVFSISSQGSVKEIARGIGTDMGDLAASASGGFVATFPAAGEVRRFDAAGKETGRWPVPLNPPVPAWPVGIVLEPSGEMVVADRHGHRLVALDPTGRAEGIASRAGWAAGLLRHPSRLDRLPDGRILVVDQSNGRLQVFKPIDDGSGP